MVILHDHHVHKTAALLTSPRNQIGIGRRNKHYRHQPDMLRQSFILFLITLKTFFLFTFQSAIYLFRVSRLMFVLPLQHEEVFTVPDILGIYGIGRTLTKGKKIHSVQQIGFSFTVMPDETIHLRREGQLGLRYVLIIQDRNFFQYHP